jgi:hypothetical protein
MWKQISAISVIFALLHFSFVGIWFGESSAFAVLAAAYSLICLFSFFNVSYVRDFDALQVNIVPMFLTLCSIVQLHQAGF